MNRLQVNQEGGYPLYGKDLDFILGTDSYINGSIYDYLCNLILGIIGGNNCIISGCEVTGSAVAAGWVFLNGRIYKVDAHTKSGDYFKSGSTTAETRTTEAGTAIDLWRYEVATLSASSGNLSYTSKKLVDSIQRDKNSECGRLSILTAGKAYGSAYEIKTWSVPTTWKRGKYVVKYTFSYSTATLSTWINWKFILYQNGVQQLQRYVSPGGTAGSNYLQNLGGDVYCKATFSYVLSDIKAGDTISLYLNGATAPNNSPFDIELWEFDVI
jgi:hypothetical protein